jgi:hypothetical protein
MGIKLKDQIEIFNIITTQPECVDWHCIGRHEPSPEAYLEAASFMSKGSDEHEVMKNALLKVFPTAKDVRYYRQLKLLALIFDTDDVLNWLKLSVRVKEGMRERGLTTIKNISEALTPQNETIWQNY